MSMCKVQHIKLTPSDPADTTEFTAIDFFDGTFTLRFGNYGFLAEAKASVENVAEIVSVLSAMLIENEQEMAALSGDYENESKEDVLRDEAWYDSIEYVR